MKKLFLSLVITVMLVTLLSACKLLTTTNKTVTTKTIDTISTNTVKSSTTGSSAISTKVPITTTIKDTSTNTISTTKTTTLPTVTVTEKPSTKETSTVTEKPTTTTEYKEYNEYSLGNVLVIEPKELSITHIKNAYERFLSLTNEKLKAYTNVIISLPSGNLYLEEELVLTGNSLNNLPLTIRGNDTHIYGGALIDNGGWMKVDSNRYRKYIGSDYSKFQVLEGNDKGYRLADTKYASATIDYINKKLIVKKNDLSGITVSGSFGISFEEKWANNYGRVEYTEVKDDKYYFDLSEKTDYFVFDNSPSYRSDTIIFNLLDSLSFLDEAGEFYYDKSSGYLYIYPYDYSKINETSFVIPTLKSLISTKFMVNNLTIENIDFSSTCYNENLTLGFYESQATTNLDLNTLNRWKSLPASITIGSDDQQVRNCTFSNLSTHAISISNGVNNVTVEGCDFNNIGASAVYIGDSDSQSALLSNIIVRSNHVNGYGKCFKGACGIMAYYVDTLSIVSNTIEDGAYTGISAGWGWLGNNYSSKHGRYVISYNKIFNTMNRNLFDGGPIYVLGSFNNELGEMFNEISYNEITMSNGLAGIYLDEGSTSYHVHHNLLSISDTTDAFHGTLFTHNPMESLTDRSQNSNCFENNYAIGSQTMNTSTYVKNIKTYTGYELDQYNLERKIVMNPPIAISSFGDVNEFRVSGCEKYKYYSPSFLKFMSLDDSYTLISSTPESITFSPSDEGIYLSFDFISYLYKMGYRSMTIKYRAISEIDSPARTVVYYASNGDLPWNEHFGHVLLDDNSECLVFIDVDTLYKYNSGICLQPRDEKGAGANNKIKSTITLSDFTFSSLKLSDSSNFKVIGPIKEGDYVKSVSLSNVSKDGENINMNIKEYFDLGYSYIVLKINNLTHMVNIYLDDVLIKTIDTKESDTRIEIGPRNQMIRLETVNHLIDENYREMVSFDLSIIGEYEPYSLKFRNDIAFNKMFSNVGVKSFDYEKQEAIVSGGSSIKISNMLIELMRIRNIKKIEFDCVTSSLDTNWLKLVTVYNYIDGTINYPMAFTKEDDTFHIVFESNDNWENFESITLVARDERGYNTAENESIKQAIIRNISFS